MQKNQTTEEKIKEAARTIFYRKGYGSARTREIAEAAGINTALLNYYFRSKENLFNIIMNESIDEISSNLVDIINDPDTALDTKLVSVVNQYMKVFLKNPNLPLFVLSQLPSNSHRLVKRTHFSKDLLFNSVFLRQLQEHLDAKSVELSPLNILINIVSLTVMPVMSRPLISHIFIIDDDEYMKFIEQRRELIPQWIGAMIKLEI